MVRMIFSFVAGLAPHPRLAPLAPGALGPYLSVGARATLGLDYSDTLFRGYKGPGGGV